MRSFTYGELKGLLKNQSHVAYCCQGDENRGSIAFISDSNTIVVLKADGVFMDYIYGNTEESNFELWAFIHDMRAEEDMEIRQQAVNRLFEAYCIYYRYMQVFQEYPFNVN